MSVTSIDLHKAIVRGWDQASLDNVFKDYWSVANRSEFPVLHDLEAGPAQPFPYCIFNQGEGQTSGRMTSSETKKRFEIRDLPWEFRIHARAFRGVAKSAKQIASELAEEVIKVFGGHPGVEPIGLTLTHGGVLQITYVTDFSVRDGEQEYTHHVKYEIKLDVPVAI